MEALSHDILELPIMKSALTNYLFINLPSPRKLHIVGKQKRLFVLFNTTEGTNSSPFTGRNM